MTIDLALPVHPSALHPITGLPVRAVYIDRHGRARFPIMGGDGTDDGDDKDAGQGDGEDKDTGGNGDQDGDDKDLGFPKDTPVSEMTDAQARRYFEHKASKEEKRRKGLSTAVGGKTADQLKADMAELEELRKGKRTDSENQIAETEKRVRAEERGKAGERIAKATFEGALSHLEKKDRDEILDGLSFKKYIDDDGEVDTDKVRAYAARIAPVDTTTTQQRRRDFGSGQRREGSPSKGAGGKAEAERRFKKTSTTTGA